MPPTFSDLDVLYKTTICKLSEHERLLYCKKNLENAQHLLEMHAGVMDSYQKNQVRSLISAIKNEIKIISTT
jgi:hypothetical protein